MSSAGEVTNQDVHTITQERHTGVLDSKYYIGIPGILKLLEVVFSIIAYMCVECLYYYCIKSTDGYFKFVTSGAAVHAATLWMLMLFKISRANWPLIEFILYTIVAIFYMFANIFMSMHCCTAGHKAGVAFGWAAFIVFCCDLSWALWRWIQNRGDR